MSVLHKDITVSLQDDRLIANTRLGKSFSNFKQRQVFTIIRGRNF